MKKPYGISVSSARMRRNQQHGCLGLRYLIRAAIFGILFCCSRWLLHGRTHLFVFQRSSPKPSVGGFHFPDSKDVSSETIFMYSKFNPSIFAERDRIKFLLEATGFGNISIKEALGRATGIPVKVTRKPRPTRANAWTFAFLDRRIIDSGKKFLQLSKTWLGDDDEFNPRVIMQDLIEKVKKPLDLNGKDRYQSCAVVGSSGILLSGSYGQQIDSHEMVIRLNNAELVNYTAHVGSKTTLSFINGNVFQYCSQRKNCMCNKYGNAVPIVLYVCQAGNLLHVAKCMSMLQKNSRLLVTHSRFDALCGAVVKWYSVTNFLQTTGRSLPEWDAVHDELEFHYSSGMQAVMLALGICDSVDLYGFGKSANASHHYHTKQKEEFSLHDYAAEYLFYDDVAHNRTIPFLSEAGILLPPLRIFF